MRAAFGCQVFTRSTIVRNALMRVAAIVPARNWIVAAICLLAAVASAQPSSPSAQPDAAPVQAPVSTEKSGLCLREGTRLVDEAGRFQTQGERLIFVTSEGERRFTLLENLNLERIARALGEGDKQSVWRAAGSITEYQGANYLLVERAVLVSSTHTAGTAQAARVVSPAR
jgi:hypothetical protein